MRRRRGPYLFGGGGAQPEYTITGLELDFANVVPSADWVGLIEVAIYDQNGTNVMPGLTANSDNVTSLDDLSAGEFGTNSTFDDNESNVNEGWPSSDTGLDGGQTSTVHWAASKATGGIKLFVKLSSAIAVTKVEAILRNIKTYTRPELTITDQDSNSVTIALEPQSDYDHIWADTELFNSADTNVGLGWYTDDYEESETINDVIGVTPVMHLDIQGYSGSGDIDNTGSGGSAYDIDPNDWTYVAASGGTPAYFNADGSTAMELANGLAGAELLDCLRCTDTDTRDVTFMALMRLPSLPSSGTIGICGTTKGSGGAPVQAPDVGAAVVVDSSGLLKYDTTEDAAHTFHNTSNGEAAPTNDDFAFGSAHSIGIDVGANSNHTYRGYVSNTSVNGNTRLWDTRKDDGINDMDDSTGGAGTKTTDDDVDANFYIGGLARDVTFFYDALPQNSRIYEFLIFDQYLTPTQMFKVHKYWERKHKMAVRS